MKFISDLAAYWWQYKGRKKQEKGQRTGNERLVVEGKRDELAGMIKARYGYPIARCIKEAEETNV